MPPALGAPTLILVPTPIEEERLADCGGFGRGFGLLARCGFGPIAAAARTAELLATLRPSRALLVGIAGAYDVERHPPGSALEFGAVAIDGVGAGEGRAFQGPPEIGFPQWPGGAGARTHPIVDRLALASSPDRPLLLTTCAASSSPEQAAQRRARFPGAVAEDMEGFAVAFACALAGVPLRVVRGVSNEVGDRDPRSWRIPAALAAARRAALEVLVEREWPGAGPEPAP